VLRKEKVFASRRLTTSVEVKQLRSLQGGRCFLSQGIQREEPIRILT
jgi:hypothetical protein